MQKEYVPSPSPRERVGGADIYIGRGIAEGLPELIAERFGSGRTLLVYDGEGESLASREERLFKGFGSRVTSLPAERADEAEECCLLAVGVGGERAMKAARAQAEKGDAECAFMPTSPASEGLCADGCDAVFLDGETLDAAGKEEYAAAVGLLSTLPVRRFEDAYAEKVLAVAPVPFAAGEAEEGEDGAELALKVLKLREKGRYACDVTADMLALLARASGRAPRRKGEYAFAAACALGTVYRSYLSSPAIDTLVPADHDALREEIARLTGTEKDKLMQAFDIFDVSGYFRINYVIGEYRMDLLSALSSTDLGGRERRWRRMYADAGFWLKKAFTARDMLRAMELAGEMSGGLLGYMSATGLFAAMLPSDA